MILRKSLQQRCGEILEPFPRKYVAFKRVDDIFALDVSCPSKYLCPGSILALDR